MPWLIAKKSLTRCRALLMLTSGLVLFLGLSGCSARQKPASPLVTGTELVSLNQAQLPVSESGSFKFVVAGHIYGSQDEKDTMPDHALVDQLPAFNQMGLSMFISLGDIVEHAVTKDFNNFLRITGYRWPKEWNRLYPDCVCAVNNPVKFISK